MSADRHYRPFTVAPGWPVEVEVHGADGSHLVIVGIVDSVPKSAANTVQKIVVRDAQARVVDDDTPPARS